MIVCHIATGKSCNLATPPTEDRSQFGMWAIVSSPLVLSVDLTNKAMLDRIWPIVSNKEAVSNRHVASALLSSCLCRRLTERTLSRHARPTSMTTQIAVNQHWNGSPGQLLLTERVTYPSPLSAKGYYTYPGQLGQARGWKNVPGMGPAPRKSKSTRSYLMV